jgi:hypothetical protein
MGRADALALVEGVRVMERKDGREMLQPEAVNPDE